MAIRYPSKLPRPVRLADVRAMLDWWERSGRDEPQDVSAIRCVHDALSEMAALNRALMNDNDAIERMIDDVRDRLDVPASGAAQAVQEEQLVSTLARDILREADRVQLDRRKAELRNRPHQSGPRPSEELKKQQRESA